MIRHQTHVMLLTLAVAWTTAGFTRTATADERRDEVVRKLNAHASVEGTERTKCYRTIFDAYLNLSEPPMPLDESFNLTTIWPGMSQWPAVAGWAESNSEMADAMIKVWEENTIIFGLPYGEENVPQEYRDAGLMVVIGLDDSLRNNEFRYMYAIEVITAYSTAETYRLMEAGNVDRALRLALAQSVLTRQLCDRDFLIEKLWFIDLLSSTLSNMRDVFYTYQNKINVDWFNDIGQIDIPFLNPDRSRLFMPEADRILAEALIREVFDESSGRADAEQFATVFGAVQSEDMPLTRFGAARRWANIAAVHGSLDASLERLSLVYDDWWRRWRVEGHDPILEIATQFEATNPVRYAAVLYSMQNIEELFTKRDRVILEVNGTSIAAAVCAYHQSRGTYPDRIENMYGEFARKSMNTDPYDYLLGDLKYDVATQRTSIDLLGGKRLWVEPGQALLWGRGRNIEDDRASVHSDDGSQGDIVIWPPIKALAREQGVLP